MRFNIDYLRAPEYSKGAGIGAGFAAFGDSLMKIGQIGKERQKIDDENQRYQEEKLFKNDELNFRKNSHAETMKAKADELVYQKDKDEKDRIYNQKKLDMEMLRADKDRAVDWARANAQAGYYGSLAQERTDKLNRQKQEDAANVAAYRQFFPNETKGKSDAEVLAIGNIMQRFSSNKAAPGDESWVKVDAATYNEYAHLGVAKNSKDGYYLNKNFVDELAKESDAKREAKGEQSGYKERKSDLAREKPFIFGDDGAM
ncbi:hypothetical protein [uncultured Campylobacter sp.]|uniref:hypothetical protein n=1 Tax=uncultured Campylobacter sp. TaxID=218934 RepID=UPI00204F911E|nr:hypothetical protein [uncultured Campylobacter sp.]DAJ95838.1 MAG TPA: hypothetical protein [Caudoviricetes sp.]